MLLYLVKSRSDKTVNELEHMVHIMRSAEIAPGDILPEARLWLAVIFRALKDAEDLIGHITKEKKLGGRVCMGSAQRELSELTTWALEIKSIPHNLTWICAEALEDGAFIRDNVRAIIGNKKKRERISVCERIRF